MKINTRFSKITVPSNCEVQGKDFFIGRYYNSTWNSYETSEISVQKLAPIETIYTLPLHETITNLSASSIHTTKKLSILDFDYDKTKRMVMKLIYDSKQILNHPIFGHDLLLTLYISVALLFTFILILIIKKSLPLIGKFINYLKCKKGPSTSTESLPDLEKEI